MNSSVSESQPTSAFSYTPASPVHHPASHAPMHQTHTDSPAQSSTFTSSSSLPPLIDSSTSSQRQRTVSQSSSSSQPPVQNGTGHHVSKSILHLRDEPSRLPPSQSPFITLLQKNRGRSNNTSPTITTNYAEIFIVCKHSILKTFVSSLIYIILLVFNFLYLSWLHGMLVS